MKLTKKGYLVISLIIFIVLISGSLYAYFKSPTVQAWVKDFTNKRDDKPLPQTTAAPVATVASSDAEIRSTLLQEVIKNPEWRKYPIEVEVKGGNVKLHGAISSEAESQALVKYAQTITDVKTVKAELEIKGAEKNGSSTGAPETPGENPDDRLAKEVEFACYKTDAFDLHNIKISATTGQVTLRGEVRSRAESLLAERIAREVPGVKSVTNQLEIKKE